MNYRVFLSLCVTSVLAVPLMAQMNAGSDQPASQASSASQSDRDPLKVPKPRDFWDGDDPSLVSLVTHPFANKKYVHRLTVPIRDRLNELDEITSEQKSRVKDVDARTQQGLQLASERTSLSDQHVSDAAAKAQLAQTAATQASTRVSSAEQMVNGLDQFKGNVQTEIRFRSGQSVLSKDAKDALDQMAAPLKGQRNYIVEVRGFAPGSGTAAIATSQMMADSVVRYLVLSRSIPMYRIYQLNMGNAATGEAAAKQIGARVEVSVLKNELVNTAQR